jgi:aerobic-type carbon monoxide dehydrogenase small subunit (CoxS/CutS family)
MATTEKLPSAAGWECISFSVNGRAAEVAVHGARRLSRVLRDDLGLTGTKVGCDAGDCGACTVLLNGDPVCSCLTAVGQIEGCEITTVEGLALRSPLHHRLQQSFLNHGAAQCGACTPGMLVAATALLERNSSPDESEVMDAIGGVLCRCTGYRKIISAVMEAGTSAAPNASLAAGAAVGARLVRLDGKQKTDGTEIFGADESPHGALGVRVIRSPYHRARFHFGDLDQCVAAHPSHRAGLDRQRRARP